MGTATAEQISPPIEERYARLTRRDVVRYLGGHGVMGGTRSLADYEMAKQTMFKGRVLETPGVRARITRWIANYIGV